MEILTKEIKTEKRKCIKWTIEKIKLWVEENTEEYVVLSNEYYWKIKLEFKCPEGHIFPMSWDAFVNEGRRCPKCDDIIKANIQRYPIEKIYLDISKRSDYKFIRWESNYNNNRSYFYLECENGHEFKTNYDRFITRKCGCPDCYNENRSREKSGNWKGGITPLREYLRKGKTTIKWKTYTIKFCNYKCVLTNMRFEDIHHLYGFDLILQDCISELNLPIFDDINKYSNEELIRLEDAVLSKHYLHGSGILLVHSLHDLFHKKYKYGKNTKEQFKEFVTRLESGEFNDFLKENNLELNINYKVLSKLLK